MWRHLHNQYYVVVHWDGMISAGLAAFAVAFLIALFWFRHEAIRRPSWRLWVPTLCIALAIATAVLIAITLNGCFELKDCLPGMINMTWGLAVAMLGLCLWGGYAGAVIWVRHFARP